MSDTPKRFEEWEEVDCNQCERYWLNQCDGVTPRKTHEKGSKMPCSSFLATRKVVIPLQIKRLQNEIKWLKIGIVSIAIIDLIFTLLLIFGG